MLRERPQGKKFDEQVKFMIIQDLHSGSTLKEAIVRISPKSTMQYHPTKWIDDSLYFIASNGEIVKTARSNIFVRRMIYVDLVRNVDLNIIARKYKVAYQSIYEGMQKKADGTYVGDWLNDLEEMGVDECINQIEWAYAQMPKQSKYDNKLCSNE